MDRVLWVTEDEGVATPPLVHAVGFPTAKRGAPRRKTPMEARHKGGATVSVLVVSEVEDALVVWSELAKHTVDLSTKIADLTHTAMAIIAQGFNVRLWVLTPACSREIRPGADVEVRAGIARLTIRLAK